MILHIQNMVCLRCELLLTDRLVEAGLPLKRVQMGLAEFERRLTKAELCRLDELLAQLGLARTESRRAQIVSQIKVLALDWVQGGQAASPYTWSHHLSSRLGLEYSYVSHLFREETGRTLEGHLIALRTELAKGLLRQQDITLTEVADRLGYSSLPHFSAQFKKATGQTPSDYRRHPSQARALDTV